MNINTTQSRNILPVQQPKTPLQGPVFQLFLLFKEKQENINKPKTELVKDFIDYYQIKDKGILESLSTENTITFDMIKKESFVLQYLLQE